MPARPRSLSLNLLTLTLALPLLSRLAPTARAQCVARLPTVDNPSNGTSLNGTDATSASAPPTSRFSAPALDWSNRIINGLEADPIELDNIVTITHELEGRYLCVGSLIAPQWVLTAAQCSVVRRSNRVLVAGEHALTGEAHEIEDWFYPEAFDDLSSSGPHRGDIMLIKLTEPIAAARVVPSPGPSPAPESSSSAPDTAIAPAADTAPADPSPSVSPPAPTATPYYNYMRINTNPEFGMPQAAPRYLRLKGYGMTEQPGGEEPLFGPRLLRFADIKTAPCGGQFGSDGRRRICTVGDRQCGPCFGDTGSPLYDVDASGTTGVLVGILHFDDPDGARARDDPPCVTNQPVVYTAVAPYADWILRTVGNGTALFYALPPSGITNTRLAPEPDSFPVGARISLIVVSSLALIATLTALLVTCVLRYLRRRRRRWIEGLHAEDSFVKAGEKHAAIMDPFEGITDDQRHARPSISGIPRAAFTGATEFSARSMQKLKALIKRAEEEEMMDEPPRLPIQDGPTWLDGAWERLFRTPSKAETDSLHRISTQRIVDDVLEGGDKSVEPSLDSVAFKSARDELNLELAWQRLEIKTSLRNMSEAGSAGLEQSVDLDSLRDGSSTMVGGYNTGLTSPLAMTPRHQGSRNASRNISRNTSGGRGTASPSNGVARNARRGADIGKADALLAAFASIDAESEHVAEETVIDSSALKALASAKRPTLFEALRRKLSQPGLPAEGREDRLVESDSDVGRTGTSFARAGGSGRRTGGTTTPDPMRMSPRSRMSPATSSIQRAHSSVASSSNGASTPALLSRQSSMHMDYFSRDYEMSGSESESEASDDGQQARPSGGEDGASELAVTEDGQDEAGEEEEEGGVSDGERSDGEISGSNVAMRRGVSGRGSRISFEKLVWGGVRDLEDRTDSMDARFVQSRSIRVAQVRSFESLDKVGSERSSSFGEVQSATGRHAPEPPVESVLPEGTEVQDHGSRGDGADQESRLIGQASSSSGSGSAGGSSSDNSSVMKLKQMWSELGRRDGMR